MSSVAEAFAPDVLSLVDHHCHGIVLEELDRPAFERLITEGDPPLGTTHGSFDSPVGLAIRRWCAPVLGLEPHVPAGRYLERRAELGAPAAIRLLLRASDTGMGLRRADPLHLAGLIRRFLDLGVNLVLLHCYPFHRHARYLAAAYRNV